MSVSIREEIDVVRPAVVEPPPRHRRRRRERVALGVLASLLTLAVGLGVCLGATRIGPASVLDALLGWVGWTTGESDLGARLVLELRLPRVLLGVLAGATLAVAGAATQGVFRNPLADPGLIGLSSGAMVSVVATITLGHRLFGGAIPLWAIPVAAFCGALACALVVQALARHGGGLTALSLILAGVAINALCGAVTALMYSFASDVQLRSATFWSLGSLGAATWPMLALVSAPMALATLALMRQARVLDAFQLGDAEAGHLGVRVARARHAVLTLVALGVGAAVAVAGVIGFVGLVVPHLIRLLLGANHRVVLPASALAGAGLLVLADLMARTLAAPAEIPVGALTALLGAPYFLWLMLRAKEALTR